MGQHRAKPPKAPVTREPITPLIIQRLVAAVADTKFTRLKIIAGRHSKQDVISVVEPASRLNLLQIGVIMNNIAAVQYLLSIGASKDVLWDPLDGVENSWDLSYLPDRVFNDFQNFCINLASPNVAQHAFEPSGFTLLHIAALVGHKEMVRFLMEQAGIPVDVRAAVTGTTPLMTAITRGCVTEPGLEGPPTHVCGIPASHEDASSVTCTPMWPIAELLLELGADVSVVDNSGACLLATAAEAGRYGMLTDLLGNMRQVWKCCPRHAGHLLYGVVSNWVRTGSFEAQFDVFSLHKMTFIDSGRLGQFREDFAAPIKRRKSAVVDRVLKVLPGNELMVTHALCRVMIGKSSKRYSAMRHLLTKGVPISALRLGQQHYTVTGICDVDMLLLIVATLSDVHGLKNLEQHCDILFGLWADAYLHPFEPSPEMLATRTLNLEECAAFFHSTGTMSDQSLWPKRFSPGLCERYDFCALGKPVSPLVLAAAGGVPGAVSALLYVLRRTLPDLPDPKLLTFLNQPDPCGRLPLIEAIVRGRFDEAEELVECGADFAVADGLGRMALHEVAMRGETAVAFGNFCVAHLKMKDTKTLSKILNSVAPATPNQSGVTLAEMVVYAHAWYLLPQLVELGLDVHWTADEKRHGKLLLETVISSGDVDTAFLPAFLTGPSLPAALRVIHDSYKTNALGLIVAGGFWMWLKPMLDVCRREGLNPDELLVWHVHCTEDDWAYPTLFIAVEEGQELEHLTEAGYNLGPFMGFCIDVPMHASGAKRGEDGTPLPVVWEKFSMLMWASVFGQSVAVKSLLHLGMDPNFQPTPKNSYVPSAISAALNSDIAVFSISKVSVSDQDKLECVLELLRWKAAVTQDQLRRILRMMYEAQRSKVAKELWAFLQKKAAACAACGLIGDWRTCARCKAAFYCSRACQHNHWLQHRDTCQQHMCDKVLQAGTAADLHAAPEA